jgi:hypothetical protein
MMKHMDGQGPFSVMLSFCAHLCKKISVLHRHGSFREMAMLSFYLTTSLPTGLQL